LVTYTKFNGASGTVAYKTDRIYELTLDPTMLRAVTVNWYVVPNTKLTAVMYDCVVIPLANKV
jgi:hypothetical protein